METSVRESGPPIPPPRVRVLIADDDFDLRELLKFWLERHGLFDVVEEAADGVQAVDAATRLRPELAVLDLAMPRMDGLEAAAEIRRRLPDTRIVIRSSFSAERMAQKAIDAGADAYVEKAADHDRLLAVLQQLVPARSTGSGGGAEGAQAEPAPAATSPDELLLDAHDAGIGDDDRDAWSSVTTELLEAAVISSPVGAVLLDGSARLVIANPVADRLLGGTVLLGADPPSRHLHWADTRKPVLGAEVPIRATCERGVPFDDLELLVTDEAGSDGMYVRVSGRPALGPHGTVTGAVISVFDDTAAKQAELELAATHEDLRRSNAELAEFASTVSHDLSQPLQKIYGFARLMQGLGPDDPHLRDHVDRIVLGCERMRTLIQDLLAYSQLTSDARPLEEVELTPLVREVVELFEQQIADEAARIEVDPLPTVLADRTQMTQLFQNLIGNALTYVADDVPPVIHVRCLRGEREWQISVVDNGIGIDPEDRQRVFERFERLVTTEKYSGTGIGLAVCAKIVHRHGGRIWVDGNPGGGTSISFTLADRSPR